MWMLLVILLYFSIFTFFSLQMRIISSVPIVFVMLFCSSIGEYTSFMNFSFTVSNIVFRRFSCPIRANCASINSVLWVKYFSRRWHLNICRLALKNRPCMFPLLRWSLCWWMFINTNLQPFLLFTSTILPSSLSNTSTKCSNWKSINFCSLVVRLAIENLLTFWKLFPNQAKLF